MVKNRRKEKTMDKISIIVPVFNSIAYLEKCVNSLLDQTYKNIEILLIDDCSTDGSSRLCDLLHLRDDRIKVYHQPENAGVSAARNIGISMAKGEYIGFCDSDDWLEKDTYEYLINLQKYRKADISSCNVIWEYSNRKKRNNFTIREELYLSPTEAIVELHKGKYVQHWLCNKLFRQELFKNIRLQEDLIYGEDYVAMCNVLERCSGMICGPLYKYHYRQQNSSACNQKFRSEQLDALKMFESYALKFSKEFPKYRKFFQAHYLLEVMAIITSMIKGNNLNKKIVQNMQYILKQHLLEYWTTPGIAIYLKISAFSIAYNLPLFVTIYCLKREEQLTG